jgi:hypothetical protein
MKGQFKAAKITGSILYCFGLRHLQAGKNRQVFERNLVNKTIFIMQNLAYLLSGQHFSLCALFKLEVK